MTQHAIQYSRRLFSSRRTVALAAAAVAAGMSLSAGAQTAAAPDSAASAPQAEAPKGSMVLETVVVTAQRRKETLDKTPLAISAIKGEDLAVRGVSTPQDLTNTLPNVQNGVAGFAIRGISSGDDTEKGDPSTAFSLDGVYIARPQVQTLGMYDLERVEVVRGPQGTLYGRNATAGAINVITAKPVFGEQRSVGLEVGNYGSLRFTGVYNTQTSESSALRLAVSHNQHDGFTETRDGTRALDSRKDTAVRGKYRLDFDKSSLMLTADYAEQDDSGRARLPISRAISGDKNQYYQNPGRDGFLRLKSGGLAAEYGAETEFGDFTSITGYRRTTMTETQLFQDKGSNWAIADMTNTQFSQEFRLSSAGSGPFQWVTGLFYFQEETKTVPVVYVPVVPLELHWDLTAKSNSTAAFAQGTYTVMPGLRAVGGVRYTRDHKERAGTFTLVGAFSSPYDASISNSKANWKAGLEYDLTKNALLYANVSTGYKAGGFNDGNPKDQPALYYNPENLTSYEVGVKGRFLENRLYLATSVFHYNYSDLQLSSIPITGGTLTLNAAKATLNGLEVEGAFYVTQDGRLEFSGAYLDAKYDQYLPLGAGGPSYAGVHLDRSPKGTARIGYTHDFPVAAGRISAGFATKYSSAYTVSDFNVPRQFVQEAYWRTDAQIGYYAPKDRWYVQAFVRNIENKRQLGQYQFDTLTITDPRQFGIRGQVKF